MLEAAARRMNRAIPRVPTATWRALEAHEWPGNVRELGNVMERLVIYHAGREVDAEDLGLPPPSAARLGAGPESSSAIPAAALAPPAIGKIVLDLPEAGTTFDDLEREILTQVLARSEGNQSRAARTLGLSESTLRSRLKRLGLKG